MADQNEQLRAGLTKEVKEWADIQWPKGKRIGSKGWVDGLVNRVMYQIGLAYPKTPEDVAGEAYQVIGALSHVAALDANPEVEVALDHFSTGAQGDILPWGAGLPTQPPLTRADVLKEVLQEIVNLPKSEIYYLSRGRQEVYDAIVARLGPDAPTTAPPSIETALQAIADLPTADNEEQEGGRGDAYRAVEALLEDSPVIHAANSSGPKYFHETIGGLRSGEPLYTGQQEYVERQAYDALRRRTVQLIEEVEALTRAAKKV